MSVLMVDIIGIEGTEKKEEDDMELAKTNKALFKKQFTRMKVNVDKIKKLHHVTIPVDTLRQTIVSKFEEVLNDGKKASNLEKSVFNASISSAKEKCIERSWENSAFKKLYTSKARSILFNIKNDKNSDFTDKIRSGELKVSKVPHMSSVKMFPALYEPIIENLKQREFIRMAREAAANRPEQGCGMFKCDKCGKYNTTYYSLQIRGADEPMTNFITCLECNNRWKD